MNSDETSKKDTEKFKFLDKATANEPHIYEVLNVILNYQTQSLPSGDKPLATAELLKNSRKIKMPFTTTRGKTIEYLLNMLLKRYPNYINPIVSFEFSVNESSKKLNVNETVEYTVLLNDENYNKLLDSRDRRSIESMFELLKKYRFFNLSKLLKITANKADITRIVKKELGKNIFTFKNYSIDKNKIEWAEDFCFHTANYESVKKSLNLETLKNIISIYADSVKRELGKFGILNADFSDYRDTKLSYIFKILTDNLSTTLSERDMVDVKNIQSLVSCLNKVDQVLNPVLIINEDIVNYVRENKICRESDIINAVMELSEELFKKWATEENLQNNKIIYHKRENGENYLIDGTSLFDTVSKYNQLILYQPEKMEEMSPVERRKIVSTMDLLCEAVSDLIKKEAAVNEILDLEDDRVELLRNIISEYIKSKEKKSAKHVKEVPGEAVKQRTSLFKIIADMIKSFFGLFSGKKRGKRKDSNLAASGRREISHETRTIYQKINNLNSPVIPLSDFIDLKSENNNLVTKIIEELQEHNLKIVVPVYNAQKILYPKRSKKLLIPDIEYLLVSPELVKSADAIRSFTDSLAGYKLKEDILSSNVLMTIEKFLLTIHRQKRRIPGKK